MSESRLEAIRNRQYVLGRAAPDTHALLDDFNFLLARCDQLAAALRRTLDNAEEATGNGTGPWIIHEYVVLDAARRALEELGNG